MSERGSTGPSSAVALVLLTAALTVLAPHATADEQGDVTFSMTSLEGAEVRAKWTMTGEDAQEIREGADQFFGNSDGTVQPEEAQAMEEATEEAMEDTEADAEVTLDGIAYDLQIRSLTVSGLAGTQVSSTAPVDAMVIGTAVLREAIEPGASHTFWYEQDEGEVVTFRAPPGYEIASTQNVDDERTCRASTDRGNDDDVTIELAEAPGACASTGSDAPSLGLVAALVTTAAAAVALRRR